MILKQIRRSIKNSNLTTNCKHGRRDSDDERSRTQLRNLAGFITSGN